MTDLENRARREAILECVAWLAMHFQDYQPEALAGEMASELFDTIRVEGRFEFTTPENVDVTPRSAVATDD